MINSTSRTDKPLVTIAIPTFNRADQFLKYTLESALSQTYPNLEIIIADNCSSDNTETLIGEYKDNRIIYFKHPENIGPFRNMNFCLEQARGSYFLMLHDDDLIDPAFIETCMSMAEYKTDVGIIIAGAREIDSDGNTVIEKTNPGQGRPAHDMILLYYTKRIHLFLCSILFNTAKLRAIGGFNEYYRYLVDVAAEFELIGKYGRVDVPDVLGSFRAHMDSYGKQSKIIQWCDDSLKLMDLACELFPEQRRQIRKAALTSSADRMYRYALRINSVSGKFRSFFTVWAKFGYRYFPKRNQIGKIIRPLEYLLFPGKTLKKAIGKMLNIFS